MGGLQQVPASPCMGCDEREVGCHTHCIAYKAWHAKYRARDKKEGGDDIAHGERALSGKLEADRHVDQRGSRMEM